MDQASRLRKVIRVTEKERMEDSMSQHPSPAAPRVVAVTSGKGGVGKTNVVGNMAMALSKIGKKVLIFDADLGLANIDIIFGIHPEFNIGHVINGEKTLTETMVTGPNGIRIIPAGSGIASLTRLTEGQKLNLLSEFDELEDVFDIVLIDTGAGISSNVLYFNLAADECIIVATPEPTSVTDAYAMMKVMFKQHGTKHFKLLVNMVSSDKEAKAVYLKLCEVTERFLSGIIIEYLGCIPSDEKLKMAIHKRRTVMELYPDAVSSRRFEKIIGTLLKSSRRTDSAGNIKFFLKRYMEYNG